jgi:3-dehydroquinate synthase
VTAPHVLPVRVPPRDHDVVIGAGLLARVGEYARDVLDSERVAVVTDENVGEHYLDTVMDSLSAQDFHPFAVVVQPGEESKCLRECERIWTHFGEEALERSGAVFALGGGVVGDLAGFCAAGWMRGVPVVQLPTTTLAMSDAAVGGKTGVNTPLGKNLVGAFHQPSLVLADVTTLATLPRRDCAAGLAEVVKCAILEERDALTRLRDDASRLLDAEPGPAVDAIVLGAGVKIRHVGDDPLERTGRRALLNLGHTTAHALENERGYGQWRHGEAVAVGLVVACRLAATRGLASGALTDVVSETLAALDLPTALPDDVDRDEIVLLARLDKKRLRGAHRMVLPLDAGGADVFEVDDAEFAAALA